MTNYDIHIYDCGWKKIDNESPTKVLEELLDVVRKEIAESQGNYDNPRTLSQSLVIGSGTDKIEFVFLDKMRYRRCTVYPLLQYSLQTEKVRVVAYGTDQILHDATSFGTSISTVDALAIKTHCMEYINSNLLTKKVKVNATLLDKLKNGNYTFFLD